MESVRVGIAGFGAMGMGHAKYFLNGKVPNAELVAVSDIDPARLDEARDMLPESTHIFDKSHQMFEAGVIDATLISTPHYAHPTLAIDAFNKGLHVLVEKPAGVYTRDVVEMNQVAETSGKCFAIMFQKRFEPIHQKMHDLVASGELGEIMRTHWTDTAWLRTQNYYETSTWRGTWSGEGGGVLFNQCPHTLDLFQWICGLPTQVRAWCGFGKHHDIEVEDDVTAFLEYENGATGTFICGTGEAPGVNRLEVVGDKATAVMEHGQITLYVNSVGVREYIKASEKSYGGMETETKVLEIDDAGFEKSHAPVIADWVESIRKNTQPRIPGVDGIRSLELANAMLMSGWLNEPVSIPVDAERYYALLQERIEKSTYVREATQNVALNVQGSY